MCRGIRLLHWLQPLYCVQLSGRYYCVTFGGTTFASNFLRYVFFLWSVTHWLCWSLVRCPMYAPECLLQDVHASVHLTDTGSGVSHSGRTSSPHSNARQESNRDRICLLSPK